MRDHTIDDAARGAGGGAQAFDRRDAVLAICGVVLVAINLRPGIVSTGPLLPAISAEFGLSHAVRCSSRSRTC